jgi:hypothetical protein
LSHGIHRILVLLLAANLYPSSCRTFAKRSKSATRDFSDTCQHLVGFATNFFFFFLLLLLLLLLFCDDSSLLLFSMFFSLSSISYCSRHIFESVRNWSWNPSY